MPEFSIHRGRDEDVDGIARLHAQIWPGEFGDTKAYTLFWKWLFREYPASEGMVMVGADSWGEIVGHGALAPLKFLIHGKIYRGGFICDLMVDEDFRKEMLFPKLEIALLSKYKESNIDFVYALINIPQVLRAHLAFGFKQVGNFPVYARPYDLAVFSRRFLKSRFLFSLCRPFLSLARWLLRFSWRALKHDVKMREYSRFDHSFVSLLDRAQAYFPISTLRTPDIMNWRFKRVPGREYTILAASEGSLVCGYVVMRCMPMKGFKVLAIVDILFPPERKDIGKALLRAVHQEAVKERVEISACLLNPHDPLLPVLKKFFYIKTPEKFTLIVHSSKKDLSPTQLTDWHLSWFNHDSV